MSSEWDVTTVHESIELNPSYSLKKGSLAKKIAMADIDPFTRKVSNYEVEEFKGGSKFKNGDTLLARITPCLENGKTAFVSVLQDGEIGFGSTEFIVMKGKKGISDDKYVYYLSISPEFRNIAIKSMSGTSGRQRAQIDAIAKWKFKIPPLHEQKKISVLLSSIDDKIELNNAINKNLEEMAQALFKRWFVDFEFPNENGDPYKSSGGEFEESEQGLIPKGWRFGGLSELINVKYGKDHKKLDDGSIPVYGSGGIMRYVDKALYSGESVLIPRKGSLNNVIYINEPFWSVDTMFYTEMNMPYIAKFVYLFVSSKNLVSMNVGSAVPSMTTDILNKMPVTIPPKYVFKEFDRIASALFDKIGIVITENKKLAVIRDTLLSKLMSGEIRVPQ